MTGFSWFSSIDPGKYWDSTLKQTTNAHFYSYYIRHSHSTIGHNQNSRIHSENLIVVQVAKKETSYTQPYVSLLFPQDPATSVSWTRCTPYTVLKIHFTTIFLVYSIQWLGYGLDNRGSILSKGNIFPYHVPSEDLLWGPPRLLFNGNR
jgi:hypothetical protein